MTIDYDLETIQIIATGALKKIKDRPDSTAIADLIPLLKKFDSNYKEFCTEMDNESLGDYAGDCYENGVNIEYQIEADWWHKISLIVRKMK